MEERIGDGKYIRMDLCGGLSSIGKKNPEARRAQGVWELQVVEFGWNLGRG